MTHYTDLLSVEIPFSRFYETSHNAAFDTWLEYEQDMLSSDHGATPEQLQELADKFYKGVNWRAVYRQYAVEYCEALCVMVKDESHEYVTDASGARKLSEGVDLSIAFEELKSPRFYNYETDRIYGRIPIQQLEAIRAAIPSDVWAEYVKEEYTSYDGFMSYHSNDASAWPDDLRDWGEARLGSLLACYIIHILGGADKAHEALSWGIMGDAFGNGFIANCIFDNASEDFRIHCDSLRKD